MKLIHEVEHNEEVLEVEFEGYPRFEEEEHYDGRTIAYASMEHYGDPVWDKSMFSIEENISIEKSLFDICNIMCKELEKEAKEMEGEY